jgi:hypothetical protein
VSLKAGRFLCCQSSPFLSWIPRSRKQESRNLLDPRTFLTGQVSSQTRPSRPLRTAPLLVYPKRVIQWPALTRFSYLCRQHFSIWLTRTTPEVGARLTS